MMQDAKNQKGRKKRKELYKKPQMKKVYSAEHDRQQTFELVASSGGGGCSCY